MKKIYMGILLSMMILITNIKGNTLVEVDVGSSQMEAYYDVKQMVAGDSYDVNFMNKNMEDRDLWVKIDASDALLNQKMNVVLWKEDKVLKKGNLSSFLKPIQFTYKKNETLKVSFILPQDSDNAYTMQSSKVKIYIMNRQDMMIESIKTSVDESYAKWIFICIMMLLFMWIIKRKKVSICEK